METQSKFKALLAKRVQPFFGKIENSRLFSKFGKKTWWGLVLVLALIIGGGVTYFQMNSTGDQTTTTETLQTTIARKSDLVIYASGTGTLVALDEADLGFKATGQIKEINVKVGDKVNKGDVLAVMDNSNLQIKYTQAKRALLELTSVASLASAEEAVATAETDLLSAINQLSYLISSEVYYWETQVESSKVEIEETKVALEKSPEDAELKAALTKSEAYLDFAEDKLAAAWYYYDHEYVKDKFVAYSSETGKKTYGAPNDAEVAEARAGLAQAKAALIEAQYYYSALIGEEVPEDATGSGLTTLEQTKLDLESAETDLAGASLVAPINGTIMSVDMTLGGTVESGTVVMTISDLSQQYLEVFLDESDWESIKVGYPTEVIFDILPDSIFTGSVVQIDPGLYTESGSSVVRTIVQLTNENNEDLNLPLGTSAAVDVIGGEATDAILIPIEALHDAGNGQYAVFVLTNGVPRLQLVEIGIKDLSSVEIKSGLNQGDVITTGIAETQ